MNCERYVTHVYLLQIRKITDNFWVLGQYGPSVTALLVLSVVCSMIFLMLGFRASPKAAGTTADAAFWFTLSNSTMSIVGLLITVLPLWHTVWLSQAWVLTLCCVFVAIVSVLSSIAVYLLAPTGTEWSSVMGFTGPAAQALMTLELMYAVAKGSKR